MRVSTFLQLIVMASALISTGSAASAQMIQPSGSAITSDQPLFNASARAPDIANVPALGNLVKSGAKLYYLGERSGLHGWFIIKEGQIQMIYLSPDKQTVVVGAMFSAHGENVTTPQISALAQTNSDVSQLLNGPAEQQKEVIMAGNQGGAASVPGDAVASQSKEANGLPTAPLSPGERLVQDLKASASVILGKADGSELMMVVAPGCPNCKKTWVELRDSVKAGKIQVRIIPVYNSTGTDERRVAAQLLKVQDPLSAWDRLADGDVTGLAGTPDEAALRAVQANLSIVAKWNIQGYPYLVYRGRDGRVKIVQGRPERMAAVLSDLSK